MKIPEEKIGTCGYPLTEEESKAQTHEIFKRSRFMIVMPTCMNRVVGNSYCEEHKGGTND